MSSAFSIEKYVQAAHTGEAAAWNVLYRHYHPGLYATALRMLKDMDAAKDAVQDTFIIAHLKLFQLKEATAFGSWLKRILLRVCYQAIRCDNSKWHNVPIESDSWWEDEFDKKLDSLSVQSCLHTALAQLPEVLRTTILLRYFSNFQSYEDISFILSIPIGTVRSRLNQAKLKLAEQWVQLADCSPDLFSESQEWNHFYQTHFSGMHHHDSFKNKFVAHLQKNVRMILPAGNLILGNLLFEKMIIDDRDYGSWLQPANVTSSGNISIVEAKHFNSPENPTHCPPRSVLIIYRKDKKADRIDFQCSPH